MQSPLNPRGTEPGAERAAQRLWRSISHFAAADRRARRRNGPLARWCIASLALAVVEASPGVETVPPTTVSGYARVIDGDSLVIGATEMRLDGIDAPEGRQDCERDGGRWPCGEVSAMGLRALVSAGPTRCTGDVRDDYGRLVARCRTEDGTDINRRMVELGHAVAYRRYSQRYVDAENSARAARRGIWAGRFEMPWDWRRRQATAADDCVVKGNVNRAGERIYHTTESPAYRRLRINREQGDRCFATEAEARAAGFRAPRGR